MDKYTKIVALDQHQDSITVAIAEPGRPAPQLYGKIASTPAALVQLAQRLSDGGSRLQFCYEAGALRLWSLPSADGAGA